LNKGKNLYHISLTPFLYETRVLKEIETVSKFNLFRKIYVLALYKEGLPKIERVGTHAVLIRIELKTKSNPTLRKLVPLIYLELLFRILSLVRNKRKSVVSIHVIDLLPIGAFLKCFMGIPVIYDAHELEPYTSNNKKRIFILKNIESLFVRFVRCIIVVNDSIQEIYKERFPQKRVYSVYNAPKLQYPLDTGIIKKTLGLAVETKIFLYQGGLVLGRGIEIMLEAFSVIPDKTCILVIIGYGELEDQIKTYSSKFQNIFFINAVPPGKLLEYTASCDFGISLIENSCLSYYYCLPNKVLEYLMCRKPVLVSNLKEMASLVDKNGIGVVARDFKIPEVTEGIKKLISLDLTVTKRNIDIIIDKYSWERQEVKLSEAYQYVINSKKW
jgi:glycosyltransferase involved in cell wall biosynthesis